MGSHFRADRFTVSSPTQSTSARSATSRNTIQGSTKGWSVAWRELLTEHNRQTRGELNRFRGREIQTTGDGFLAVFDGPARAVRCAQAIGSPVGNLGIAIRAGIHTGEVELIGTDVLGLAVHEAARVAGAATAGEVLVSATTKLLLAGSALSFESAGIHQLKGVCDKLLICVENQQFATHTFYRFPQDHWIHLRTTNVVESPFAAVRLRTDAARRYKKVANAEALIWKILMIAEKKFRRLNSPELLGAVHDGQLFQDGMPVQEINPKRRAA